MTIELNREAIAQVAALPAVTEAAEAGSALISLWPLTEAMQMDNDAKYAENLQVRVTRAFARILTGEDVTVPDAEFVYEGADEIPGRPQSIVDTPCSPPMTPTIRWPGTPTSGDARLVFDAAASAGRPLERLASRHAVRATIADVESQIEADAVQGRLAASGEPEDVADPFRHRTRRMRCVVGCGGRDDEPAPTPRARATAVLPILLYVNELREQCSIPRICLTDRQILRASRCPCQGPRDDGTR